MFIGLGVGFESSSCCSYYSPALIFWDNLGAGREDYIAEAASHEMGHNLGLSHDGVTGGSVSISL